MRRALLAAALAAACWGCEQKKQEPLKALAPAPLPRLTAGLESSDGGSEAEREALHHVQAADVLGHPVPDEALALSFAGGTLKGLGEPLAESPGAAQKLLAAARQKPVLLRLEPDTYLAQVAWLFAALDDAGAEVWLAHPAAPFAYPLRLRDEQGFQAWLEEPKPGKVRIIQRADGFELQTNVGKLPGADRNGPTVPARGGQQDVATLRRGLAQLKGRFANAPDACLMPSFGTEALAIATALSGMYGAKGEPIFEELCLVYPRPRTGGGDR